MSLFTESQDNQLEKEDKKYSRSYFQSMCFEQRVLWVSISTSCCLRLRYFLLLGRGTAGCCWVAPVVVVETAEVPVAVGTFVVVVVVVVLGGRPQQPMESRAVVGTAEAPVAVATFVVVVVVVIVLVAVRTGATSGSRIVLMMHVLVVAWE